MEIHCSFLNFFIDIFFQIRSPILKLINYTKQQTDVQIDGNRLFTDIYLVNIFLFSYEKHQNIELLFLNTRYKIMLLDNVVYD